METIAKKDWYRWAAQLLVAHQQEGGHWTDGGYHGAHPVLDTCLALLVLKRANLARDLAGRLAIDGRQLDVSVVEEAAPRPETTPKPKRDVKDEVTPPTVPPAPPAGEQPGGFADIPGGSKPGPVTPAAPGADENRAPPVAHERSRGGFPWWVVMILALAALALGGGATCVVLHLRNRQAGATEPARKRRKPRKMD
jgi:hypothetical protein